ncbi:MAG: SLC13 family permease [Flavobacteriales bacterium]|nr:SLC13 family permease [Flavobacteriales bacterium]
MFQLSEYISDLGIQIYVIGVILLTIVFLYREIYNTSITFLGAVGLLVLPGVITTNDVLSSFADEQVAIIVMLLVIGQFLKRSPVIENIFQNLFLKTKGYFKFTFKMTAYVSLFSGFMNNTPLVALLLPYVVDWGKKNNISPSKLLIPLSFAAIMGGGLTLIGTSTNLIANSIVVGEIGPSAGLSMFSFFQIGAPLVLIGIVYILIFGKKILPDNTGMISNFHKNKREYLVDLLVTEKSPLVGKTIGESNLRSLKGLYLVEIVRPDKVRTAPGPKEIMRAGDYIIFAGETDNIADIVNLDLGLEMPNDLEKLQHKKEVVEVIIPYNSSLSRKKIKDTDFRAKFDAAIIAVRRDGEKLYGKIGEMTLQKGDMMLCVAGHDFYKRIGQAKEVTLISNVRQLQDIDGKKSTSLIISTVIAILLPALGLISLFQSLLLLFVFLLLTRVVLFGEVKRAINVNLIAIMGGALSIGVAMDKSGAARFIATEGLTILEPLGTMGILAGVYLITNLLAAYMTNIAAVSIILPIALSFAELKGYDYKPFLFCVAFAGSKTFLTPIGYQTNLMVYGPGGYKFKDYFKFGFPLTILFMVSTLIILKVIYF